MNNFKLSRKKIYNDSRSTLEDLHNKKLNSYFSELDNIESKKKKLIKLTEHYNLILKKNNYKRNEAQELKNNIDNLEKEIKKIENGDDLMEYMDSAWEFIENIDNNDKIDKSDNMSHGNENNILSFVDQKGEINKGKIYTKYINKCYNKIYEIDQIDNTCSNCHNYDFLLENGEKICNHCGACFQYIDNSTSSMNYDEIIQIEPVSQAFSYQRINHFKEWLNQLQAKEVTTIPETVINLILAEIKKERITDTNLIDSTRIKKYLKKLKLNKYYEHIPNIICKITKCPQLKITEDFEKILLDLFKLIQEPFKKYCPSNRKNFLSYSYTLHKFCQLLKKKEYLIYFPLLKSREKLFEQENIWKNICKELNWVFIPCI